MSDTPETDALYAQMLAENPGNFIHLEEFLELACRLKRERDEARAAIPAGEWVAYEDHQKVHEAASRLLVAINKQLPIGCFTLVSSEYYRLQNAIYGREGAK
ncbi:MAG: hypothetical protein WCG66_03845 [bacterium]|jgi:hypothetical protein